MREKQAYERLKFHGISDVLGFNVPQLRAFDDNLRVIQMTIVARPFVLDFAAAYLDRRPEFSEEVWADWEKQKLAISRGVGHKCRRSSRNLNGSGSICWTSLQRTLLFPTNVAEKDACFRPRSGGEYAMNVKDAHYLAEKFGRKSVLKIFHDGPFKAEFIDDANFVKRQAGESYKRSVFQSAGPKAAFTPPSLGLWHVVIHLTEGTEKKLHVQFCE